MPLEIMSEPVLIAILVIMTGAIGAVAMAIFNHVKECREVRAMLGQLEERTRTLQDQHLERLEKWKNHHSDC